MDKESLAIANKLRPSNILIAIIIGMAATGLIFYYSFDYENFQKIERANAWWLIAILILIVIRLLGYMYRIRYVTLKHLTWKQCFDVILLWEFASALSPTMVGGSAVSIYFLNREKISLGKSTAYILITTILDGVFFVLIAPIIFLFINFTDVFPQSHEIGTFLKNIPFQMSLYYYFIFSYTLYLIYCIIFSYGLFARPGIVYLFTKRVFSLPFLQKWRISAIKECINLTEASKEIRGKNLRYWMHLLASTSIVWVARFLLINALLAAFIPVYDHVLILGRQVVMWTILIFTPTPGGSFVAELVFPAFLGKFVENSALWAPLTFFWRFLTYYPYLIIGAFILPRWLKRVYRKEPETE
ncbi:flippase-like domain-containing protein [Candidatus Amoebophilus asiaticus]|nr:flippase-like domain-containing protein [Candidatus Amoebophilus asiaticus]